MDVPRHDADLALLRLDDARAVGSDESALGLLVQMPLDLHHILLWETLRDAHDERDLGLDRVNDRGSGERRGHVDY